MSHPGLALPFGYCGPIQQALPSLPVMIFHSVPFTRTMATLVSWKMKERGDDLVLPVKYAIMSSESMAGSLASAA